MTDNRLDITYVNPTLLKKNPWNPNQVDPLNQEKITNSLDKEGFFKPILVRELDDGGWQIIGGEHRVDAAIDLKHEAVPILNLGTMTDGRAKLLGQIDNGRYGDDDSALLAALFSDDEMGSAEDILALLPIDESDLMGLFGEEDDDISSALDDLLNEEDGDSGIGIDIPDGAAGKTHQILRFKVSLDDSDKLSELINKTRIEMGFDGGDDLQNSGDALVQLLLGGTDG